MFLVGLATDYDGTIATDGDVPGDVLAALRTFKATGRNLILVTGRELDDLLRAFPGHHVFDRIVAENGAVIYEPRTKRQRTLAEPPPGAFIEALRRQKVRPLSVGRVITATWEPNETIVLETIKQLGLELEIIFNKGAVMVLPPGVNKASGLSAALRELELAPINVAAVGDAENDHAFMMLCGLSAAVGNALPQVKETADLVLKRARGAGAKDFMVEIAKGDGALLAKFRSGLALGKTVEGKAAAIPLCTTNLLVTGHSAVGKSTMASQLTERMSEKGLQFCVLDPESDFEMLENAVHLGSATLPPSLLEAAKLLEDPGNNLVINALSVPFEDRPKFFAEFLSIVGQLRLRSGRPHWVIVDEAHHVLPDGLESAGQSLPQTLEGMIFITVHPANVDGRVLRQIRFVAAAGQEAGEEIRAFCKHVGKAAPRVRQTRGKRQVLLWDRATDEMRCFLPAMPTQLQRRHTRKYAQGELGPDKSFYFRGMEAQLNLRAHNLNTFLDIGGGVDEGTWDFHRRRGDYSNWLKWSIKDRELAEAASTIERDARLDTREARNRLREEIEKRYTAPAKKPS